MNLGKFTPISVHDGVIHQQSLAFIGMEIIKADHRLETCVYQKCKTKSLLRNILHRTRRLSSTSNFFFQEHNNLNGIFLKLRCPAKLINSTIHNFQLSSDSCQPPLERPSDSPLRVTIPIKYHKICQRGLQTTWRTRRKDQPRSTATFYPQKDH